MDKVARLSKENRAALFRESAATRNVAEMIIEKDFWVCWLLRRLFALPQEITAGSVFKGGTSLSKAYGAIRRFSEDIDLSFDRSRFGFIGDRDPEKEGLSGKQIDALIKELVSEVEHHVAQRLIPALQASIAEQLGDPSESGWSIALDPADPQNVNFQYPPALVATSYGQMAYITPRVKLEMGARGDPYPTEEKIIGPYAAYDYPTFFEEADTKVIVLSMRRTFWEKATILHAEAHRPADKQTPQNYSRHYYDLAMLLDTPEGKIAAEDFAMLAQVAKHKTVFFRSGWASYHTAKSGTLKLVPDEKRIKTLRLDYNKMQSMIFDQPVPSFDAIIKKLRKLEETINGSNLA